MDNINKEKYDALIKQASEIRRLAAFTSGKAYNTEIQEAIKLEQQAAKILAETVIAEPVVPAQAISDKLQLALTLIRLWSENRKQLKIKEMESHHE